MISQKVFISTATSIPRWLPWLPLKENLNQELSIYDYNPNGKIGIIKAWVKNVTNSIYSTKNFGNINVWVVNVVDEISSGQTAITYYISKSDRTLWKQEIDAGGRKMVMERME